MNTIIVGLGNPGEKFKNTRHNVGFLALDEFAKKNNFLDFVFQKKFNALVSEKDSILLLKPQTFMNESGKAVKEILKNKKPAMVVVVHDDADLPAGKIKVIQERGSAGHKGVESIIKAIGNEGLCRIRIGIGAEKNIKAEKIVLENFSAEEQPLIALAIQKAAEALELYIKEGLEKTMNEYNK